MKPKSRCADGDHRHWWWEWPSATAQLREGAFAPASTLCAASSFWGIFMYNLVSSCIIKMVWKWAILAPFTICVYRKYHTYHPVSVYIHQYCIRWFIFFLIDEPMDRLIGWGPLPIHNPQCSWGSTKLMIDEPKQNNKKPLCAGIWGAKKSC